MTIIAGFSASRQGSAPLNLAAQLAVTTGQKVVAAVIVERAVPSGVDPIEDEYRSYMALQAAESLQRVVKRMPGEADISIVVHESSSVPRGLIELTESHDPEIVVVGSSSSGLLGRVALGSVTESLVHTAAVPVAIAPRGYPFSPVRIQRLTAAYGGAADAVGLIKTSAELAQKWSTALRIASFTVRPAAMFGGSIERSAEGLVVRRWSNKATEAVVRQLAEARETVPIPDGDVVIGTGVDWRDAVENVAWDSGDLLLLGSGAAGPLAQVFLGSAASKILRNAPVPVVIMPRTKS